MTGADQNFTSLRKTTLFRSSLSLRDGVCIRADDLAAHFEGTFHWLDRTNGAAVGMIAATLGYREQTAFVGRVSDMSVAQRRADVYIVGNRGRADYVSSLFGSSLET